MTKTVEPVKLNQKDKATVRRIRKLVESTHWTKGAYEAETDDGKPLYCMVGFVNTTLGLYPELSSVEKDDALERFYRVDASSPAAKKRRKILNAMYAAIKTYKPRTRATDIESFNDSKATEREDVLAVLDIMLES